MSAWHEIEAAAPATAARVRERFEAHGLAVLATLRADGSARVSGLEPFFWAGELWLGMMPDSLKVKDLRRDPRFAMHSATIDKEVKEGDAKIAGSVVEVEDRRRKREYLDAFRSANEQAPPGTGFALFRADVREISFLQPDADHLNLDVWTARGGERHSELR